MTYWHRIARFEESIRPEPSPLVEEFLEAFSGLLNRFARRAMSYDETINERLQAGFLSDTPEGKKQAFFAWYQHWNFDQDDDGQELQRMEHEAGITPADWKAYRESFDPQF